LDLESLQSHRERGGVTEENGKENLCGKPIAGGEASKSHEMPLQASETLTTVSLADTTTTSGTTHANAPMNVQPKHVQADVSDVGMNQTDGVVENQQNSSCLCCVLL
jgi:hypothetical protein